MLSQTQPSQQTALVDFVRTLQQQKVLDPATGDQLLFDPDWNMMLWTEAPLFGINVADFWHCGTHLHTHFHISQTTTHDIQTPKNETQYINKVAFLAQLTSSPANFDLQPGLAAGPFDFSLYALWDFRQAFESTRMPTSTMLRAASLWMIYAAEMLWANVRTKRDFRHRASNGNPAKEGDAYHKSRRWVGFNRQRWDVWVEGLENGREAEEQDVGGLVEEALSQVERVESQKWRLEREEMYA